MTKLLFPFSMAATLLAATPAFAAPTQGRPDNYGYAKGHRVTPAERKRWEEAHRKDHHDDNYGFAKNHQVTPAERKHWEEAHRQDQPGGRR
ncbi:hypothetical protein GO988_00460 [Hymenobacter sp. HMF4947]|uniref:Lipoprotein n=1 Tax=Hymenobacter ginkgonis TaxID=2682976 RepID=A0A7K1T8Q5_9BACT|nr:hypothetical protein [Hymenobacter ginkgonis]MVN74789.1 hypothetical protein [Hymenobacter ginkgonis]